MSRYEVRSNIPMDTSRCKYPFFEMNVGDCFDAKLQERKKIVSTARYHKCKVKTKKIDFQTIRVWLLNRE